MQVAERVEATGSSDTTALSQNLTSVEKEAQKLYTKIRQLKQELRPTLYQIQKLERENQKIQEVLGRNIPTGSSYPWINLSQPVESEFTPTQIQALGEQANQTQQYVVRLASQLQSFSRTVAQVEQNNTSLRSQYRKAKLNHKEKQEESKKVQAAENWSKIKSVAQQISSPENIPKFQGVQYTTWKEYWKAKRDYEMMNSK